MKTRILQILGVAIVATIGMVSCTTDACKDVDCGAWGTCVEGDCVCDLGYTGTNCDAELRAAFDGTSNLSGTVACTVTAGGNFPATATTFTTGSGITKIIMNIGGSLALTCTVTSTTSFTIDNQTIDTYTYGGTGSLTGTTLSVTVTEDDPSVPETCTYTLTGTL